MMHRHRAARSASLVCLAAPVVCLTASRARAAGFQVDEHDAGATGRAGAVIASPRGASTVYYNPAGLAALSGVNVSAGVSLVAPSASYESPDGSLEVSAESRRFPLPHLYASVPASDEVTLGIGVNSPFGLANEWPAESPGRTAVRKVQLISVFITPTAAVDLSQWAPGLMLGAGLALVPASVRLRRDILFGEDTGVASLSGSAFGFGARLGLLYRPPTRPEWSFGITYRSGVTLDFDGTADFDAPSIYRPALPPDGDGATSITLPQIFIAGVAYEPIDDWQIEVNGGWYGWSSYDRLDIELANGEVTRSVRDWRDSLTLRIGTEYRFHERWAGRLGFIFDQSPVPSKTLDFQLPDDDRIDITAGAGFYVNDHLRVDAGALWVLPTSRETAMASSLEPPVKGTFSIEAWVFSLTVSMRFGGEERSAAAPTPALPFSDPYGKPEDDPCRRWPGVRALQHQGRCPPSDQAPSAPTPSTTPPSAAPTQSPGARPPPSPPPPVTPTPAPSPEPPGDVAPPSPAPPGDVAPPSPEPPPPSNEAPPSPAPPPPGPARAPAP